MFYFHLSEKILIILLKTIIILFKSIIIFFLATIIFFRKYAEHPRKYLNIISKTSFFILNINKILCFLLVCILFQMYNLVNGQIGRCVRC